MLAEVCVSNMPESFRQVQIARSRFPSAKTNEASQTPGALTCSSNSSDRRGIPRGSVHTAGSHRQAGRRTAPPRRDNDAVPSESALTDTRRTSPNCRREARGRAPPLTSTEKRASGTCSQLP
ncbi:hypothetical protein SKAU_G00302240 [Synaphobranchus kaupii]|uniref:Uncharacterized protein n=1 Tax=Synaphobranchus kaupii TaxID=118154 RepID=A0A9Q1INF2_SYNKA|nr:hypothetical protein SKAU_G00302240 [Synaphobranchus kaupii]